MLVDEIYNYIRCKLFAQFKRSIKVRYILCVFSTKTETQVVLTCE